MLILLMAKETTTGAQWHLPKLANQGTMQNPYDTNPGMLQPIEIPNVAYYYNYVDAHSLFLLMILGR